MEVRRPRIGGCYHLRSHAEVTSVRTMYGADHERLLEAVAQMRRAADELEASQTLLQRVLMGVAWFGQVASNFTNMWNGHHRRNLMTTAAFIRDAAGVLERHAIEQRDASSAATAVPAWTKKLPSAFTADVGLHPQSAEMRPVGFAQFFNRQEGLPQDQFEILKVSDNPPRYIVNLPGVEFTREGPWEQDHLRDLRGASAARVTGNDAYAERVKAEMQRAGVPAGAEVMLVGHSYGAMAAMNIAGDHSFNRPGDTDGSDGYSVQVTHVLAAGAGLQDWIDDPPSGTKVLMAINRNDVVASGIQAGDLDPTALLGAHHGAAGDLYSRAVNDITDNLDYKYTSNGTDRTVVEFTTQEDVLGHHYNNYERGLNGLGQPAESFVNDAAKMYFSGGGGMQSVRVDLPDRI